LLLLKQERFWKKASRRRGKQNDTQDLLRVAQDEAVSRMLKKCKRPSILTSFRVKRGGGLSLKGEGVHPIVSGEKDLWGEGFSASQYNLYLTDEKALPTGEGEEER